MTRFIGFKIGANNSFSHHSNFRYPLSEIAS